MCAIIGGVFTVRLCEGVRHHRGRVHGEAMYLAREGGRFVTVMLRDSLAVLYV